MRSSAVGTVVGWAVYATAALVWPLTPAAVVALVIAACFSLLLGSHLVAYMIRVALHLRHLGQGTGVGKPPRGCRLSRRQIVWTVGKAGGAALLLALFGRAPHVTAQVVCPGAHNPNSPVSGTGATRDAAEQDYVRNALAQCELICFGGDAACQPTQRICLRNADVQVTRPRCEKNRYTGMWTCMGTLSSCSCGCSACAPGAPPGTEAAVTGSGATEALAQANLQANADARCDTYCQRRNALCPDQTCTRNGAATLQNTNCKRRGHVWECSGTIVSCPCAC